MSPTEVRRKKLEQFFTSETDEKEFSQLMRKLIFQSSMLALKADENRITPDKETISEGCSFLNELCDTLDSDEYEATEDLKF